MRQEISLYLNGQQVDLNDNGGIYFNYKQKDVKNPTVVKNSFSKTLTIPGTDNNNNIFNNIWELTRVQTTDIVPYFNQSKRVPFELFLNGEVIEQGYCKLDRIRRDKVNEYDLSLFGGLGDFFYQLAFNGDTGEKRTLADLDFGFSSITMSKETVKNGWDALSSGDTPTIVFAPTYNGVPDNIDAEKVLVNTSGYTGHMLMNTGGSVWSESTGFPASQGSYSLYQGYGLVELPAALTSDKVRDMRSYLQTPMLSVKSLFSAISNPHFNGGYEVELDEDFFTSANTYYEKAYITLPRITELNPENITEDEINVTVDGISGRSDEVTVVALGMDSSTGRKKDGLDLTINLTARVRQGSTANVLYTVCTPHEDRDYRGVYYGGFACQVLGIDSRGHEVAGSNIVWVTSENNQGKYKSMSEMTIFRGQDTFYFHDQVINDIGVFNKTGDIYVWSHPLNFKIQSTTEVRSYRLKIVPGAYSNRSYLLDNCGCLFESTTLIGSNVGTSYFYVDITSAYKLNNSVPGSYSGVKIYKEDLLNTKDTPADYLLSYCKLFNLYFDRDVNNRTVKILTPKNFYDKDVNLYKDIDRKMDIQPLSFEHKWYSFNYKQNKTESLDNYKAKYGVDFGSQRVNTGYEFDGETEELLTKNILLNASQVLQADKHYVKLTSYNCDVPTFLTDTVTYNLFDNNKETTEIKLMKTPITTSTDINGKSQELIKYDSFSKVQLHNQEKPSEGSNVLLFFNGMKTTNAPYWITDDVTAMFDLNEKPTWLYTVSEYNTNGDQIAISTNNLPQFSRYIEDENNIYASWDFGRTRELFIPEISYVDGDATIYERYWRAYIQDLYDVDTRIVTAYIKFDEKPTKESLKHFYYFENSFWVIDEIIDYNPTSYEMTKVKFVKVNDKNHYRNINIIPPEPVPTDTISITAISPVPATATSVNYTVVSGDYCKVQVVGQTRINGHGPGTTSDTLPIPENPGGVTVYYQIKAWQTMNPSISAATTVEQYPGVPVITSITLDNVSWVTDVPATGGTASYQNCTYTVTGHYDNGTTTNLTSQAIFTASTTLNVPATTSTTRENVGVINVIAEYYDGPNPFSSTVVVPVYQEAAYEPTPERYVTLNLVYTGNTSTSFPVITVAVANVAPQTWTPTYVGETYDMVFSAGQVTDSTIMVTAVDQVPPYLNTISGGLRGGSYSDTDTGPGQVGITMQINFSFGQSTVVQFYCDITGYDNN